MNSIVVDKAGLLTTIQDSGRQGMRHLGIPWSGSLVPFWQKMANALVGNTLDNSVIECFEGGLAFTVGNAPARIAIVADKQATISVINDSSKEALSAYRSHTIMPGDQVLINNTGNSRLAIIAIAGLDVEKQLGSTSTYSKAGIGGLTGGPLKVGDALPIGTEPTGPHKQCEPNTLPDYQSTEIRVVLGPQDQNFSQAGISTFLESDYTLSTDVDRMGARLDGNVIEHLNDQARDPVSDAIVPGSIQVPGSGLPIVLLSDAHTAGGYPKIATVLSIDLPLFGLQRSGAVFRFKALSIDEAIETTRAQHQSLSRALAAITSVIDNTINSELLLKLNLIDGVIDGRES
ncbi:MAG: biotin-dependent carboxyltransferase family protein [Granulosicoccus sp.]